MLKNSVDNIENMIDPIGLFDELDKTGTEYEKIRDAQKELLNNYVSEGMNHPRIGLKLPTGSGKSLIAILLLESYRRAGKRVAILCANKARAHVVAVVAVVDT